MNAELKAKWVAALRSGKYKQARMVLRDENDGFCCLGVLCDVVDSSKWATAPSLTAHRRVGFRYGAEAIVYPDDTLVKMFSGDDVDTDRMVREFFSSLAGRNDAGTSFEQIADLIERSELL